MPAETTTPKVGCLNPKAYFSWKVRDMSLAPLLQAESQRFSFLMSRGTVSQRLLGVLPWTVCAQPAGQLRETKPQKVVTPGNCVAYFSPRCGGLTQLSDPNLNQGNWDVASFVPRKKKWEW